MAVEADQQPAVAVGGRLLIWDLSTRLFHWLLVLSLAGSWITAEAGFDYFEWHLYFGYTALVLISFRLVWGLLGPRYARFRQFLTGPRRVIAYVRGLSRGGSASNAMAGHGPPGGWAVMLMLGLVGVQAGTGLFISDDIFFAGPYNGAVSVATAEWLRSIHHTNFSVLQGVVVLHLLAIVVYRWWLRHHLVAPMITGYKHRVTLVPGAEGIERQLVGRALIVLAVVAGLVFALVWFAPPPAPIDFY